MIAPIERYRIRQILMASLGYFVFAIVIPSTVYAQNHKPPPPKEPVSDLHMPKPVTPVIVKGKATLPEQLRLGFALDVGAEILGGNWDFAGKITEIEKNRIGFVTDQGKTGNFLYRFPLPTRLPVRPGNSIIVKREIVGHRAALGYRLLVTSSATMIIASGRLFDESPHTVKVFERLSISQSPILGRAISKSRFETIYDVPVKISGDGDSIEVNSGRTGEVIIQDKLYLVHISRSTSVKPSRRYEGIAEGSRYALEYIVFPK